jgi:hypothetical protein
MELKFFVVEDYLKGKPVYPAARRALSFLFSVSITSFIFERCYFRYTWMDIADYKAIIDFFIKGYFFVPFCLYVIVHFFLDYISRLVYDTLITIKADKVRQKILRAKYKKSDAKKLIKALNENNPVPFVVDEPWLFAIYQQLTNTYTPEQWKGMVAELEKAKRNNEHNFRLVIKGLITISIYFTIVPYFGWKLYLVSILLLIIYGILLFWTYLFMEVTPIAIQKIYADVTDYFAKQQENQTPPADQ